MDEDEYNYEAAAEAEAAEAEHYAEMEAAAHAEHEASMQGQYDCEMAAAQAEAEAIQTETKVCVHCGFKRIPCSVEKCDWCAKLQPIPVPRISGCLELVLAANPLFTNQYPYHRDWLLRMIALAKETEKEQFEEAEAADPKSVAAPTTASTKLADGATPAGKAFSEVEQ
ncbi:MAG: hypothetical protein K2W95_15575 [Candidatus Obscuribacterales bacterium]|nr:hypothetical protein [Candidatus Obscuribacterales bacterium]